MTTFFFGLFGTTSTPASADRLELLHLDFDLDFFFVDLFIAVPTIGAVPGDSTTSHLKNIGRVNQYSTSTPSDLATSFTMTTVLCVSARLTPHLSEETMTTMLQASNQITPPRSLSARQPQLQGRRHSHIASHLFAHTVLVRRRSAPATNTVDFTRGTPTTAEQQETRCSRGTSEKF